MRLRSAAHRLYELRSRRLRAFDADKSVCFAWTVSKAWQLAALVTAVVMIGTAGGYSPSAWAHELPKAFTSLTAEQTAVRSPSVRLSTTRAPSGRHVRLKARRLGSRVRARITFGGRRLRTLRTLRDGTLRAAFRVPARKPGVYTVAVRAGRRVARARFRVLPGPVGPSPPAGTPAPARQTPPVTPPASAAPPAPLRLVAAGDIACRPTDVFNEPLKCRHGPVSERVLALDPDAVATLGDAQYENATLSE